MTADRPAGGTPPAESGPARRRPRTRGRTSTPRPTSTPRRTITRRQPSGSPSASGGTAEVAEAARFGPGGARAARSRTRRRIGALVRLVAALAVMGGIYAAAAPAGHADDTPPLSGPATQGKALFDNRCITCHGPSAQGVEGRGPSLVGVGSAAVEFQVETGRMPMARQEVQAPRKPPQLTKEQARQLGQYIQALGGGPQLPEGSDLKAEGDDALARGGELFRLNCAACHGNSGGGGALSAGKYAPSLDKATDRQIYAAMLTGPQNMPVFGNNELSDQEKREIIAYVQHLNTDQDPGGWGLGRFGPVPEGLAIFLVGITALAFAALWIAGKS